MKTLTAIYRTERNGNVKHMIQECSTKSELKNELKSNGLKVLAVLTNEDIEKIKKLRSYDLEKEYMEYVQQVL